MPPTFCAETTATAVLHVLLRSFLLSQGVRASYIKPVQAGSPSDASFVSRHAGDACRISTLFDYTDPVSPHLAAARDGTVTPDDDIVEAVVRDIKQALSGDGLGGGGREEREGGAGNLVLVEAAGGVLSPAPSGSLQADAFRAMRLPVLLIGDGKLGGIGATLSALESLRTRGYSVLGVALIAQGLRAGDAGAAVVGVVLVLVLSFVGVDIELCVRRMCTVRV